MTTRTNQQNAQLLNVFALLAPQLLEGPYPMLIHGFEEASATFTTKCKWGIRKTTLVGRQIWYWG